MAERLISPRDFATGAPPRIMGTEAEDTVQLRKYSRKAENDSKQKRLEDRDAMINLLSPKTSKKAGIPMHYIPDSFGWLTNGQKIYIDAIYTDYIGETSFMLESCTAEQKGPRKALAGTIAATRVVQRLAQASEQDIHIYRRTGTVDKNGRVAKAGFHMNHNTTKDVADRIESDQSNPLVTHSATRLFTWEGMVSPEGFVLSQKGHAGKNVLFRCKEYDLNGFRRVEDYSGDDGSPWGTFMAMATTSVLLRILEHPEQKDLTIRLKQLKLINPHKTIRTVSADTTMKEPIPLVGGRKLTAIEIQTELADIAAEFGKRFTLPADEQYAVEEWQRVCRDLGEAVKTEDMVPLIDRIGWVGKKHALEKKVGGNLDSSNSMAVYIDMKWDSYYPKEGGRLLLPQKTGVTIVSDAEIERAVTSPPHDTRAVVRSAYITEENTKLLSVDWGSVVTEYLGGKQTIYLHPYQTEKE